MSDRRIELGFERTVRACPECKRYCRYLPGVVIPSDLECLMYSDNKVSNLTIKF
jgi:hypothetical protein